MARRQGNAPGEATVLHALGALLSDKGEVEDALVEECPAILIIEGTPSEPSYQYQGLSEHYRRLSIIVLDSTGVDSIIRLRDIGFDVLLRLIRSVAANLSEGHGRSGRDRLHHWRIDYASAKEVDTHLRLLVHAAAVNAADAANALDLFDQVRAMTWRLVHPQAE